MKYVIGIVRNSSAEHVFIFPRTINHNDFAKFMRIHEVRSAGFFSLDDAGEMHCYGKSESLNVPSRPQDTELVKKEMNRY